MNSNEDKNSYSEESLKELPPTSCKWNANSEHLMNYERADGDSFVVDMEGWGDSDFAGPERSSDCSSGVGSSDDLLSSKIVINVTLSKLEVDNNSVHVSNNDTLLQSNPFEGVLSMKLCQDAHHNKYRNGFSQLKKTGYMSNTISKEFSTDQSYVIYPIATHLTMARTRNSKLRDQILKEANPPPTVVVEEKPTSLHMYSVATLATGRTSATPEPSKETTTNKQVQTTRKSGNSERLSISTFDQKHPEPKTSLSSNASHAVLQGSSTELSQERKSSTRSNTKSKKTRDPPTPTTLCGKCWLSFKNTACIKHCRSRCHNLEDRVDGSKKFNTIIFILVVVVVLAVIACIVVYPILVYKKHHTTRGGRGELTKGGGALSASRINVENDY